VLIISQDNISTNPNDRAKGGTLSFVFPVPVTVDKMTFLDTENTGPTITLSLGAGGSVVKTGPVTGDRGQASYKVGVSDVVAMTIKFPNSGAVDNIKFNDCDGGGGGDPHIKPFGGERYYFMGECDSVLHASRDLDVHIRTTIKDNYSYIEASAIRVGNSVVEMSTANPQDFFINGQDFTTDDLPLEIEGKYTLQEGAAVKKGLGTNYQLAVGALNVNIRVMKFIMGVEMYGIHEAFEEGTAGLMGQFPHGTLLGRDGTTVFEHDGVFRSVREVDEPVCNAIGQEWQVRDTDPQLFREIRRPVWPHQCRFPAETTISDVRRLTASVDVETAAKVCAEVHKKDSADFEFCIMDVIAMDDVDAAYAW